MANDTLRFVEALRKRKAEIIQKMAQLQPRLPTEEEIAEGSAASKLILQIIEANEDIEAQIKKLDEEFKNGLASGEEKSWYEARKRLEDAWYAGEEKKKELIPLLLSMQQNQALTEWYLLIADLRTIQQVEIANLGFSSR